MNCLTAGSGTICTRWIMLAGVLASAVAAFVLVSRLRQADAAVPDAGDDIHGM